MSEGTTEFDVTLLAVLEEDITSRFPNMSTDSCQCLKGIKRLEELDR